MYSFALVFQKCPRRIVECVPVVVIQQATTTTTTMRNRRRRRRLEPL
jgi:hypothetical protein